MAKTGMDLTDLPENISNELSDWGNAARTGYHNIDTSKYESAGISSVDDMVELTKAGIGSDEIGSFGGAGTKQILDVKNKYPNASNDYLASMFQIARTAPQALEDFKQAYMGREFGGKILSESDVNSLYRDLQDFRQ